MPQTIPFDPSLVLGNVISMDTIDNLKAIADKQVPAEASYTHLQSLITLKHSIDMTVQEMLNLGITDDEMTEFNTQVEKLKSDIINAAKDYAKLKIQTETDIQPLRAKIKQIDVAVESPIDYGKSDLKSIALSSDSLMMDVQYFALDSNDDKNNEHAKSIKAFVSSSLSHFGKKAQGEAGTTVQKQVSSQVSKHKIAGTLVISINCTHKNARVFEPFVIDPDKAVRAWNAMFTTDTIKTNDPKKIAEILKNMGTVEDKSYSILSGATYGSSFVGMVHVLNVTDTKANQNMDAVATSLQANLKTGAWFASRTGGFGVAASFADSVKNLLSTQNIQSHCSLFTMGVIPSIVASEVEMGVKVFNQDEKPMEQLAALQGATAGEEDSIGASAEAARTGQQLISLKNAKITATLSALADIEKTKNSIIDTNSMMTAMDDYIKKCTTGTDDNVGVPINFFLKPVTKSMIALEWLSKYYPESPKESE